MELLKKFWKEEQGQDLIEYALLAGFISLAAVAAITNVGIALNGGYGAIEGQVNDAFPVGG